MLLLVNNNVSNVISFELGPEDNARLANLCGQFNEHIKQLEKFFEVSIETRSNYFNVIGSDANSSAAMTAIKKLYEITADKALSPSSVQLVLNETTGFDEEEVTGLNAKTDFDLKDEAIQWSVKTNRGSITGRGFNQVAYLKQIKTHYNLEQ